jgi:hypothetical protein
MKDLLYDIVATSERYYTAASCGDNTMRRTVENFKPARAS